MSKRKYSLEFKRQVALHYLNSGDGARATAHRFGIDHGTVRIWTEHYKVRGDRGFLIKTSRYSAECKASVIHYMWDNGQSLRKTAAKFGIAGASTISRWERLYRQGGIIALHDKQKGQTKLSDQKKTKPANNTTTNPPEFNSLQEELEYLRAENAYLKKLRALIQERQNSKLRTKHK